MAFHAGFKNILVRVSQYRLSQVTGRHSSDPTVRSWPIAAVEFSDVPNQSVARLGLQPQRRYIGRFL